MSGTYTYQRDGQTIQVSSAGFRLIDTDGTLLTPVSATRALPDDVLADTVVSLVLAGWEPVTE